MAGVPIPAFQQFWTDKRTSLKTEYSKIIGTHPDATAPTRQLFKVLCDIEDLANFTPSSVGKSEQWAAIASSEEDNCESYCKALSCKRTVWDIYSDA
jgi:hypothetical protein